MSSRTGKGKGDTTSKKRARSDDGELPPAVKSRTRSSTPQEEEIDPTPESPIDDTFYEVPYPVRPNTIQFVQIPKTHVNHTYRDFSGMPRESNYAFPVSISVMTFHERIYHLLSSERTQSAMSWCLHGRAFRIVSPEGLEDFGILRCFFGYNCLQRFQKQLSDYGYKALSKVPNGGCYYSEFLLQGLPHVLQYSPEPHKRRKLLPDPDNEPNFEDISYLYPLPRNRKALLTEARQRLADRGIVIFDDVFETVVANYH